MSAEVKQSLSTVPESGEPRAGLRTVPVWLFVVLAVMVFYGMVYFDERGGWFNERVYAPYQSLNQLSLYQPATGGPDLARGKAVYENVCGLCHNNDGNGKPGQAPPLAGSEWAQGSPARMIRIPLAGLAGPIKVKDQEYNLNMAAMGAALSDDDLAAVLTYIRSSWGNKAPAITPGQVKAVRAEVGNRTQPWSADELNRIQ
jgi:mono/diheme cytochrome c family protein